MDQDFETFWAAWPRKVAKADARKAWNATRNIRPDLQTILTAVHAACRTEQWMRGGGQFIPYPATWIRGERWEDQHTVTLAGVVNEKPWYESATGIEAKGAELGLRPDQFPTWPAFKQAVIHASMRAA
jgi:hypothetical protein